MKNSEVTAEMMVVQMEWTDEQQSLLEENEEIIENGRAAFEKVAGALSVIKGEKLYLKTHPNFKVYCEDRWGFTRQWAYRILRAAEVEEKLDDVNKSLHASDQAGIENLKKSSLPAKELLRPLSAAKIKQVAKRLKHHVPTPDDVKEVVAEVTHKEPEPDETEPLNNRMATKPKTSPGKAKEPFGNHPVLIALDNEWGNLSRAMAYATIQPVDIYRKLRTAVEKALI